MSLDSIPSSSDANCVCLPVSCARIWSIEMPASSSDSLVGGDTSVRNRVDALACVPPGRPAIGTQLRLLSTSSWFRNGASGAIVGMNSKAGALGGGQPVLHDHAVGHIHRAKTIDGLGRGLHHGGQSRHHSVEQRQCDRDSEAAQHRATGYLLFRDNHRPGLLISW